MVFSCVFFHIFSWVNQEEIGISCDLVGLMGQKMGTSWEFDGIAMGFSCAFMGFLLISMGISLDIGLTMKSGTTVYQKIV